MTLNSFHDIRSLKRILNLEEKIIINKLDYILFKIIMFSLPLVKFKTFIYSVVNAAKVKINN